MKKLVFLSLALMSAALSASASYLWVGECGVEVITVSEDYFQSKEEAAEYYQELEEIFCGN
jgi:hypothetical protein